MLTTVMWTLMLLVKVMLLCSVVLTSLTAVVLNPTKLESGIFPVELEWGLRECLKMNFTEIGDHKLYASIVDKAHSVQKEDISDVKYQIPGA